MGEELARGVAGTVATGDGTPERAEELSTKVSLKTGLQVRISSPQRLRLGPVLGPALGLVGAGTTGQAVMSDTLGLIFAMY